MSPGPPLLEARGLVKHFPLRAGPGGGPSRAVRAVDGVDLAVRRGETLAIVGESGSGKTTLGRLLLALVRPTAGSVRLEGRELATLGERALRPIRRRLQLVFQDPYASLSPRLTVARLVAEPLVVHGIGTRAERSARVAEQLARVGLPADLAGRFPHELSGGQRQRVAIARALACGPDLLVGDEPVAALDVSVRAQIVNLLLELRARLGLTLVLISHDLGMVRHLADRILVLYRGRVAECAPAARLFDRPLHPYTRALLAAIPRPRGLPRRPGELLELDPGTEPEWRGGCRFAARCAHAVERCRAVEPELRTLAAGHEVACHRAEELAGLAPAEPVAPGAGSAVARRLAVLEAAAREAR